MNLIQPCHSLAIFQKIFRHQWRHEAFFHFIKFHRDSVKHVYIHHIQDYWLAIPIKINNAQANNSIVLSSVASFSIYRYPWSIADITLPSHIIFVSHLSVMVLIGKMHPTCDFCASLPLQTLNLLELPNESHQAPCA